MTICSQESICSSGLQRASRLMAAVTSDVGREPWPKLLRVFYEACYQPQSCTSVGSTGAGAGPFQPIVIHVICSVEHAQKNFFSLGSSGMTLRVSAALPHSAQVITYS